MVGADALELTWAGPNDAPQRRTIGLGETLLGRDPAVQIVLDDPQVSRQHASIQADAGAAILRDLGSRNGTYVNGDRIDEVELQPGDQISLGRTTFEVGALAPAATGATAGATTGVDAGVDAGTVLLDAIPEPDDAPFAERIAPMEAGTVVEATPPATPAAPDLARPAAAAPGIVTPEMLASASISEAALRQAGVEVRQTEFAALGGGVGSFAWVDLLRVCGVPSTEITVVGLDAHAIDRYRRLCANSQIPDHERLRSHSESCPDNVWGFPGYSVRESWAAFKRGKLRAATAPIWGVLSEPVLGQTWTPRGGDVFNSLDREEERIGWESMRLPGRIRAIRKSDEGRIVAIISLSDATQRRHIAVSARFLHLAVGYPAIQLLPELGTLRERTGDRERVINAYEEHDHVYTDLRENGGAVLIRGRGIVASRIIQRLVEERRNNPNIQIIHLHRSRLQRGSHFGRAHRRVEDQFEMQPFNWPKACWGGELRRQLESADGPERKRLLDIWGGTTTANRSDWRGMIRDGSREGWYRAEYGAVEDVDIVDGKVVTRVSSRLGGGGSLSLSVEYVIDCTGLVAGLDRSPLLADLTATYDLPRNPLGRLAVSDDFEVSAMRNGDARMYAAGAPTMGGPFAAVDSFLGLQYAALRSVDDMRRAARGIKPLRGLRSLWQWQRWMRGVSP
jgi:pSer/pThr/pTyr-binding forkhead associated (FHA) protein